MVDARALAEKSAQGLNMKIGAAPPVAADGGGLAFEADAASDLDSGWIIVRPNGDREFVSVPPFAPIAPGPKFKVKPNR